MDAVFIDANMNKKNFLYQYDVGQRLMIEDFGIGPAPKVQFSIKSIKSALSVDSEIIDRCLTVKIPDMLLTYGENIVAYIYRENGIKWNTVETVFISVIPRKRPADYIYTDEMFVRSVNGSIISDKACFAEVAEWEDGNVNNEDRCGYFVTVAEYDDGLIIDKSKYPYDVCGIVVRNAGFVSNCTEDKLDKYGQLLSKYAYVCTSGIVPVKDNGKCVPGQMCKPSVAMPYSIAVPVSTANKYSEYIGYRVISRIDDNHILIFFDPSVQMVEDLSHTIKSDLADIDSHIVKHESNKSNPHAVTKQQVGLDKVDNTSDAEKPISNATQDALDALEYKIDNLALSGGLIITDSVTNKQYTLGMQDGKLVVILVDDSATT